MNRQAWAFLGSIGGAAMAIAAVVRGEPSWVLVWGLATAGFWLVARDWNRRSPSPFPYRLRWLLRVPRIAHSPRRLLRILKPYRGEHLLEIGPGIGTHALRVASAVAPEGLLVLLDVQREMLHEVRRRAAAERIINIRSAQGDAAMLPFRDQVFDGAYLIGVLGEIPDQDRALRELWRVLKSGGRLVIGEILVDPDYCLLGSVRNRMATAGFAFHEKIGTGLAYVARFHRSALDAGVHELAGPCG